MSRIVNSFWSLAATLLVFVCFLANAELFNRTHLPNLAEARKYLADKGISDEMVAEGFRNTLAVSNSTICSVHMIANTFDYSYYGKFDNRSSEDVYNAYLKTFKRAEKLRGQLNIHPVTYFPSLGDEHLLRRYSEYSALSYCNASDVHSTIGKLNTRMGNFTDVSIVRDYLGEPLIVYTYNNDTKTVVVTFRGSQNPRDLFVDVFAAQIHPNVTDCALAQNITDPEALVHAGFWSRYVTMRANATTHLNEAMQSARELAGNQPLNIVVVGHSLGGSWSALQTADWMLNGYNISALYTFGSPMIGNLRFVTDLESIIGVDKWIRVVNRNDMIPHVGFAPNGTHPVNVTEYFVPNVPFKRETIVKCNGGIDPACSAHFKCLQWSWYHHSEFAGFSMHGDFCRMNKVVPSSF